MNRFVDKDVRMINWMFPLTIGVLLVNSFLGLTSYIKPTWLSLVADNMVLAVPVIACILINKGAGANEIFRFKKVKISVVLFALLIDICIRPLMTVLNAFSMLYSTNVVSESLGGIVDSAGFAGAFFAIAIAPAVLEELTYRGGYLGTYRKTNPFAAIILSGLVFGLMHMNLNQFTYAFVMGCMFALITEAADSVVPTMIIHLLTNGFSVVTLYALPRCMSYLRGLLAEAIAAGDTQTIEYLDQVKQYLGVTDFSEGTLNELLSGTDMSASAIFSMIGTTLPSAIIGTILCFVLIKAIAKRSGTTEYMESLKIWKRAKEVVPPAPGEIMGYSRDEADSASANSDASGTERTVIGPSGATYTVRDVSTSEDVYVQNGQMSTPDNMGLYYGQRATERKNGLCTAALVFGFLLATAIMIYIMIVTR